MSAGILTAKLRFSPLHPPHPHPHPHPHYHRYHARFSPPGIASRAAASAKVLVSPIHAISARKLIPCKRLQSHGGAVKAPSLDDAIGNGKKLRPLYASLSSYEEQNSDLPPSSSSSSSSERIMESDTRRFKPTAEHGGMAGMASAFGITSQTALAITTVISISALVLPLFMQSVGASMAIKTKMLSYVTLLFGFYMAWNIGANDVANAMGTSVGSGALSLPQAVLAAAILEFAGAFLIGSHVSHTMQKGILVAEVFRAKSSLLFCGMLASLAAAGTWLQVASYYGWPVSTTHCIIGAMVGFGLVFGGIKAVFWKSLARVVSSWVVSPVLGAVVAFVVYKCIRVFVYSAGHPGRAAATAAPISVFVGASSLVYAAFPISSSPVIAALGALGVGIVAALSVSFIINKELGDLIESTPTSSEPRQSLKIALLSKVEGPTGVNLTIVYTVFGYLQVLSACFMSFAHGANDVANAIGPISAALAILQGSAVGTDIAIPVDVLAWGGFGIVAGLLVWGYRVIATIGKKITELTPTRGFAAEFAAATVVVLASRLGLPISATHTLVGAVMGVGFARGLNSVHGDTVREIVASWIVTIPVGAILSVGYTAVLRAIIPSLV